MSPSTMGIGDYAAVIAAFVVVAVLLWWHPDEREDA